MLPTNGSVSLGRPTTSSRSHGTLTFELNTDSIGHPSGDASLSTLEAVKHRCRQRTRLVRT